MIVLVTFLLLFAMLDCLVANFPYVELDILLEMGAIFPIELAHIVRSLIMVEM